MTPYQTSQQQTVSFLYCADCILTVIDLRLAMSQWYWSSKINLRSVTGLRLLGIGRNQYIDLMNSSRSSKRLLAGFFNRNKAGRELLPEQPVESMTMLPWWTVQVRKTKIAGTEVNLNPFGVYLEFKCAEGLGESPLGGSFGVKST